MHGYSVQSAYAKANVINCVCRKTQALCFLPADVIADEYYASRSALKTTWNAAGIAV